MFKYAQEIRYLLCNNTKDVPQTTTLPYFSSIFGAFMATFRFSIPNFWCFCAFVFYSERPSKEKIRFCLLFLVFALWNTFTTYWIYNASLFGAVAAVCVNSILMAV